MLLSFARHQETGCSLAPATAFTRCMYLALKNSQWQHQKWLKKSQTKDQAISGLLRRYLSGF